TVQEDHGSGRRLIRARFAMRPRPSALLAVGLGLAAAGTLAGSFGWAVAAGVAGGVLTIAGLGWGLAARAAARAVAVFEPAAARPGRFGCGPGGAGGPA